MLINLRNRLRLTQAELSAQLKLDRSYYARIEKGKRHPSLELALQMAEVFALGPAEALALLRELAGLPPAPAAEATLPPAAPLMLGDDVVELLDLRSSEDGTWWATVRSANNPTATARRVRMAPSIERRAA